MTRRSIFGGGGTIGHIEGGAKLADYISLGHNQANGSTLKLRRSSRLRKITVIYESEAAELVNLNSRHHQEISTYTSFSSTKQAKAEDPLYKSTHCPPNQNRDVLDAIDTDDESTTDITLRDMLTRCKTKKRKASKFNTQSTVDMQEHYIASMMPKEEVGLEETLFSLKEKKRKSSPTNVKLNKITNFALHSSPVENMSLHTFSQASVATEGGLSEATLKGTNFDELLADSDVGMRDKIEYLNVKMKAFAGQNFLSVGSPKSDFDVKEIIETGLGKSVNENCTENSTSAFINKCDFDNICLAEGPDNVLKREVWGQPGCITSNIMDPFARGSVEDSHDVSSSSAPTLDNQQIPNHEVVNVNNKFLVVCTAETESTTSIGLMAKFKHNLPSKVLEKDDQHDLQFQESIAFGKESMHLIVTENSSEFIESDCEKLTCSLENDRWLDENIKQSLSDTPYNKIIVPMMSEFKASSSYDDIDGSIADSNVSLSTENHGNFVDIKQHGNMELNSCFGAINSRRSLDIGGDEEYNMVYGNFDEQVREPMQSASIYVPNIISQMDFNILPSNTVVLVDAPCSITEAGSPYVSTSCEGGKQASHNEGDSDCYLTTAYYFLDAVGWEPQLDKLIPSSQVHMLSRRSESQPCSVNISDLTEAVKPSGQIICHFPRSQLHEIDAINVDKVNDGLSKSIFMDTGADLPTSSSIESSKIGVERQITKILTTETQATDIQFGMEVEHSTKKLLSNRKEISPTSQKKLIWALNNGGLDDVVKLSSSMKKLCFDKRGKKKPLSSFLDNGETFLESEQMIKKPKTMNHSPPEVTKGILKSPYGTCGNPCCLKNSSLHAQTHDAILFSQRQMQDTENIAAKLLHGLNSLKNIVEATLFSGSYSFPSSFNFDEIRLATKHASKLEVTTKKWLAMMAKDCTRFCKIMRSAENKLASPVSDLHKERKKITFADDAGGTLCDVKVYEQQPVAFIVPKS